MSPASTTAKQEPFQSYKNPKEIAPDHLPLNHHGQQRPTRCDENEVEYTGTAYTTDESSRQKCLVHHTNMVACAS